MTNNATFYQGLRDQVTEDAKARYPYSDQELGYYYYLCDCGVPVAADFGRYWDYDEPCGECAGMSSEEAAVKWLPKYQDAPLTSNPFSTLGG